MLSAIMDKSEGVISGRKIDQVRRTRSIFHPEITSPYLSIIARGYLDLRLELQPNFQKKIQTEEVVM